MFISLVLKVTEKVLNTALKMDPQSTQRFAKLAGKVVVVEFQHTNFKIYYLIDYDGVHLFDQYTKSVDVILRGSAFDFLRLSTGGQNNAALFASDIAVLGDMDVAQHFRELFADLDIDWEEQFSQVTGDVMARQMANVMRAFCNWAQQSVTTLRQNVTEYVHEEARWSPARVELQDFFNGVDKVRDDVDRAALHLKRLQKKIINLHAQAKDAP